MTVIRNHLHTCVHAAFSNHGYYSRGAFISFKTFGLCGYSIWGRRPFKEIRYIWKSDDLYNPSLKLNMLSSHSKLNILYDPFLNDSEHPFNTARHHDTPRDTKNIIRVRNAPRPSLLFLAYCKRSKTGWSEGLGTWLHIEFTLQFCIGENWYISSQFGWYIKTGNG